MTTTLTGRELLQQLLAEIDETDPEMLPPPDQREKTEPLITVLEDQWLRKVFSLGNFIRREGKRMEVDAEVIGENIRKSRDYGEIKQKHDALMEIFWYGVRAHTGTWNGNVGIRKGWEVVKVNDSDKNLSTLLKRFLAEEE